MDRLEDHISPNELACRWAAAKIPDEFRERHQGPRGVGGCTIALLRVMREMEVRDIPCVRRTFSEKRYGRGFRDMLCSRIVYVAQRWGFGFKARRKGDYIYIIDKKNLM